MNEEKKDYKGLYFKEGNNENNEEDHNYEYGAHFKYKELYNKLYEIAKERNKEKKNSNKKDKLHQNNNVLKGISRNKTNREHNTGENILIYLKNLNNLTSSNNNNESFKSASFHKINDNIIKPFSNKNTINNTKNTRTVLRHALFPKNKKINDYNNINFNNRKNNNTNNSSYMKLNERILLFDKSSKSVQSRNLSTSRKYNFNNKIIQIQSNKLKNQIRNYFHQKYSKIFSNYNTLYKKISPNKNKTNNTETINKIKSIPTSRNNIPTKKRIKKNIIKIIEKQSFSKNPSNHNLSNKEHIIKNHNNIKTYTNKTSFVSNNNNNIYYNTTQTVPGFSIINLLNTSCNNKGKIKTEKILSMILNKKIKKRKNNLSHSKERSSISSSIKHSLFPSNKTGTTLNSTQKVKNKIKQKMNKPSLVLKK